MPPVATKAANMEAAQSAARWSWERPRASWFTGSGIMRLVVGERSESGGAGSEARNASGGCKRTRGTISASSRDRRMLKGLDLEGRHALPLGRCGSDRGGALGAPRPLEIRDETQHPATS